jgi:hypothetical protein
VADLYKAASGDLGRRFGISRRSPQAWRTRKQLDFLAFPCGDRGPGRPPVYEAVGFQRVGVMRSYWWDHHERRWASGVLFELLEGELR